MTPHPAIIVSTVNEDFGDASVLRLADHAIGLWRAAEAMGDTAFLEALRPLLTHVARLLAQEVTEADIEGPPN